MKKKNNLLKLEKKTIKWTVLRSIKVWVFESCRLNTCINHSRRKSYSSLKKNKIFPIVVFPFRKPATSPGLIHSPWASIHPRPRTGVRRTPAHSTSGEVDTRPWDLRWGGHPPTWPLGEEDTRPLDLRWGVHPPTGPQVRRTPAHSYILVLNNYRFTLS